MPSRHLSVPVRSKQLAAVALALSAAVVGGWAEAAPRSFYTTFPLPGRHWISALGPYNEHLVRDVGALYLALLVVTAGAAVRPRLAQLVGLAWLVQSLPHAIFHSEHLERFGTGDSVAYLVAVWAVVVLAGVLVLPARGIRTS